MKCVRISPNTNLAFALSKKELCKTPIAKHNIRMKSEAIPIKHNPYRCSLKETDFLKKEIDLLLELDCIERCEATWVMPVIMVKKKVTTDLRMCIDYRSLNKEIIIENYPLPRIEDILSLLGKYSIFTKLDIKSGFW